MPIVIDPFIYWLLWLLALIVVIALAYTRRRQTRLRDDQIIITAGFSLAGVFALVKVLVNVANYYKELQEKLDWDGITALSICCILGIVIALKEIRQLFKNSNTW